MAEELDGPALQALAHDVALELPGAELTHPFGEDTDVYKVVGKIFLVSAVQHEQHLITLKSDPEESPVLQKAYASIRPGYHMNKRHWVSVAPGPGIGEQLVRELVVDAWRRVVESLPRAKQPAEYRLDWKRS